MPCPGLGRWSESHSQKYGISKICPAPDLAVGGESQKYGQPPDLAVGGESQKYGRPPDLAVGGESQKYGISKICRTRARRRRASRAVAYTSPPFSGLWEKKTRGDC